MRLLLVHEVCGWDEFGSGAVDSVPFMVSTLFCVKIG